MSFDPAGASPEPAHAGSGAPVFEYSLRRDGRPVATLRAVQTGGGVTVEAEVHPVTAKPDAPPLTRPFSFPTLDHARRFVDEALVAFEYMNCTVI